MSTSPIQTPNTAGTPFDPRTLSLEEQRLWHIAQAVTQTVVDTFTTTLTQFSHCLDGMRDYVINLNTRVTELNARITAMEELRRPRSEPSHASSVSQEDLTHHSEEEDAASVAHSVARLPEGDLLIRRMPNLDPSLVAVFLPDTEL